MVYVKCTVKYIDVSYKTQYYLRRQRMCVIACYYVRNTFMASLNALIFFCCLRIHLERTISLLYGYRKRGMQILTGIKITCTIAVNEMTPSSL